MRLGGDEFVLIVEGAETESGLAVVASRILSAVAEPLDLDERVGRIAASLGIAVAEPLDDPEALLRKADIAMYQVKGERPGGFGFYDPTKDELPQPKGRSSSA